MREVAGVVGGMEVEMLGRVELVVVAMALILMVVFHQ
jgi:hypothetical protein